MHKLSENSSNEPIKEKKNLKTDNLKEKKPDKTKLHSLHKPIASNEDWINFFNTKKMSPFARNYFGNMSFKNFDNGVITLIVNPESSKIPENILSEFKAILKESFSKEVEVNFEVGNVLNSPLAVKDIENTKKHNEAKSSIKSDKDIENFINKFNGKIKEDTIKPIK